MGGATNFYNKNAFHNSEEEKRKKNKRKNLKLSRTSVHYAIYSTGALMVLKILNFL